MNTAEEVGRTVRVAITQRAWTRRLCFLIVVAAFGGAIFVTTAIAAKALIGEIATAIGGCA